MIEEKNDNLVLVQLVGKQYNVGGEVTILGDKVSIKGFR